MKKFILMLGAIGLLTASSAQELIAEYPFNGNAEDASGKGNDGQVLGAAPIVDRFGNNASAYFFDNVDDYIDLGNSSVFDLTTNFTVAGWFKGNFDAEFQSIIAKGDFTWRIHRYFSDDVISFATTGLSNLELPGTTNVNDNEWHHFAATYDGATKRLYIDGQLDAEIAATGSVDVNSFPVWIGANSERPDRTFNGSLDDFKIFNTALTAAEVQELSNLKPVPSDLNSPDFGNALNFGNATQSWVSIPADNLNELTDFTYETWFNYSGSTTYEDDVFALMGLGAGDQNQSMVIGRSRFEINYCPRPDCFSYTFDYSPSYQPGWNHFALTVDSSSTTAKIYVNGSLAAEANDIPYFLENYIDGDIAAFVLGRDYTTTNYFSGSMDEVRIWNYALSEEEIQSNLNFPINRQSNGLVYYFNFDEGIPAGNNLGVNILPELAGNRDGELFGFTLTGNSSNWIAHQDLEQKAPRILSTSSGSSIPGRRITINGGNFFSEKGFTKVFFGTTEAQIVGIEGNRIRVRVPNSSFGTIPIRVVNPFGASRPLEFDVIEPNRNDFTFNRRPILTNYTAAFDLDIADLNDDGLKDLVVTSSNQPQKLRILYDRPEDGFLSGRYQEPGIAIDDDPSYTEQPTHNKVFVVDLNSDGLKDILTTTTSPVNSIEWFDNATNWTPQVIDVTTGSIFPGDLNSDGFVDIILLNINELAWYPNDGAGGFGPKEIISTDRVSYNFYYTSRALYVADIDNDRDTDILIGSNSTGGDVVTEKIGAQIFVNDGNLNFTPTTIQNTIPASFGYNLQPQIADFNLDGNVDFLFGGLIAPVNLLQNDGNGNYINTRPYDPGDAQYSQRTGSISVGDFNGDGYPDFATTNGAANNESSTNFWWGENLQSNTESFFDLNLIESSLFPTAAGNAIRVYNSDLDSDGDLDLITISEFDNQISAYENVLTDNFFTSFNVESQVSSTQIRTQNRTVDIIVTNDVLLDKLIPEFTISEGASISLGNNTVVSGQFVTDFTNPVEYRIISESADTALWTVRVNKIPGDPVITEVDDITQTAAEIEWSVTSNTDTYILEISSDQFDTFETFELTGNEFIATLQPGLSYEVRVRSKNAFGLSANYSEIEEFNTVPATPMAAQLSEVGQTAAVINWVAAQGAEDYILFVARDSAFTNFATGFNGRILSNLEENIVNLQPGTSYWIRIQSRNESGISPFSPVTEFITVPMSPDLVATEVTQTSVTLDWQFVKGAEEYQIQLSDSTETILLSGQTNSFSLDTLQAGTEYSFSIRSVNASGASNFTSGLVVQTVATTPNGIDVSNIEEESSILTWAESQGAESYIVQVSEDGFTSFVSGYSNRVVFSNSENLTNLDAGEQYSVRIAALNSSGRSPFSETFTFYTIPEAPVARDATSLNSTSFTANWDDVDGSDIFYIVQVGTDPDLNTIIRSDTIRQGLSINVSGLEEGVSHWYRVYGANPGGTSEPSATISAMQDITIQGLTYDQEADRTSANPITLSFSVTGGLNQYSVTIRYKGITTSNFNETSITSENNSYFFTFAPEDLDDIGLEFEIIVDDGEDILTSVNNFIYWTNIINEIPNLNLEDQWQMFSIPYLLEDDLIDAIFDEMAPLKYGRDWRLMHYNGNSNLDAGSGISRIQPGRGYWFYTAEEVTIDIGDGSVNTASPFQMDLRQGWNQIGNPYNVSLNWNSIRNTNGVSGQVQLPYVYSSTTGTYDETNTINPFEGAFVWSDEETSIDISLVDNISSARLETELGNRNDIDSESWVLDLTIETNESIRSSAAFGMHPLAEKGKDQFDKMTLPRLSDFVDLKTIHEDYFYPWFRSDILPTADEASWLFYLEGSKSTRSITLKWDNERLKGKSHTLWLIDEQNGKVIDMSSQNSIEIEMTNSGMPISFHYLSEFTAEPSPFLLHIGELYPNPVSSGTITLDLLIPDKKDQHHLFVQVFDLKGNMVRALYDDELPSGNHQMEGDVSGLAPGVYYLTITVDHEVQERLTKKLIIKKHE